MFFLPGEELHFIPIQTKENYSLANVILQAFTEET
jgi:hypothetical protein